MSRFLPDSKLLIQHVPRTGGTWIEDAIDLLDLTKIRWVGQADAWIPRKHALLGHYHRVSMTQVDYIAAFVRHPKSYYESVWKFIASRGNAKRLYLIRHWRWHPHRVAARLYEPDFNDWVARMLDERPCWVTRLYEQYVGPEGGEFVDFIGRTETLENDFIKLMKGLGYPANGWKERLQTLGRRNAVPRKIEWDEGLLQRMLTTERLVINCFYEGRTRNWFNRCFTGPPFQ